MFSNQQTIGYALLFTFIAYIGFIGIFGADLISFAVNQHVLVKFFLYYITQTYFIIFLLAGIFVGYSRGKFWQGLSGGILINFAADFVSFPHCVLRTGFVPPDVAPNLLLCSDTIFIGFFSSFLPFWLSYYLYYLILPILLVILAFELLGLNGFIRHFKKGVKLK